MSDARQNVEAVRLIAGSPAMSHRLKTILPLCVAVPLLLALLERLEWTTTMPLHPQSEKFLRQIAELNVAPVHEISVDEARRQMAPIDRPRVEMSNVVDRSIPSAEADIPVRIFTPNVSDDSSVRGIVYYHGGGWVVGDLDTHDGLCRQLAHRSQAVVIAVDYRLAPEHPFPAAANDAFTALQWVCAQRDELSIDGPIAVAGDSAGGNLAAVSALRAREDETASVDYQMLIYPIVDCDLDSSSYVEYGEGYFLTRDSMRWFWEQYVGERAWSHPHAAPLRAESLRELPSAFVLTAEFDPLRTEGELYAQRLAAEGVDVTLVQADGMLHGFLRRTDYFDASLPMIEKMCRAFRDAT